MSNTKILPVQAYGIGRRKSSVACVYLLENTNAKKEFQVNKLTADKYFQNNSQHLYHIQAPLLKIKTEQQYGIIAKVKGGGFTGQAEAIKLALARALCKLDKNSFRSVLKSEGFLSRDARIKERRKYGLKKARKASQYSKR